MVRVLEKEDGDQRHLIEFALIVYLVLEKKFSLLFRGRGYEGYVIVTCNNNHSSANDIYISRKSFSIL